MIITNDERQQVLRMYAALFKVCDQNNIRVVVPEPLLLINDKAQRGEDISEDLNAFLDAQAAYWEDLICRGMYQMSLTELMEQIRSGNRESALRYIRLFGKPFDTDPDFEAIREMVAKDPGLNFRLAQARLKAQKEPGYPHYFRGLVALVICFCSEALENEEMSLGDLHELLTSHEEFGCQGLTFEALRIYVNRMKIHYKKGKPGRPKK